MSFVSVHIPEDGWFASGCNVLPQDKQLVIVIHKYGNQTPGIYQYRKADWLNKDSDYFLDVSEKWMLDSLGCGFVNLFVKFIDYLYEVIKSWID